MSEEKTVAKRTIEDLERQIKEAELETKLLEQEEKKLNTEDLRLRIADRRLKEQQRKDDLMSRAQAMKAEDQANRDHWEVCSHKKGGRVSARDLKVLRSTGGNSPVYCVIKHQMINGDVYVYCTRCGKSWKPPIRDNFYYEGAVKITKSRNGDLKIIGKVTIPSKGKFNEEAFNAASFEYDRALNFETTNTQSGSVQCRFSAKDEEGREYDDTESYRKKVDDAGSR